LRPRPKSFKTETRPETFETETETETAKNWCRDTSRDRDQVSKLHHWWTFIALLWEMISLDIKLSWRFCHGLN